MGRPSPCRRASPSTRTILTRCNLDLQSSQLWVMWITARQVSWTLSAKADVVSGEAGGITQGIGAYVVPVKDRA